MNISTNSFSRLVRIWHLLRLTLGSLFAVLGLDKVLRLNLIDWDQYLTPSILASAGVDGNSILLIAGIIELLIAFLIFTKATRLGAYLITLISIIGFVLAIAHGGITTCGLVSYILIIISSLALAGLSSIKREIIRNN